MSTHANVAMLNHDGSVDEIYVHCDGYFEGVGNMLHQHYSDAKKVRELIDLGDLSSLGCQIGTKHEDYNPELCTAYGRDWDEKGSEFVHYDNFDKYRTECSADKSQFQYFYVEDEWFAFDETGFVELRKLL